MIAVITPVSGRHGHFRLQRRGILAGALQPDVHVVVAMDDPDLTVIATGCDIVTMSVEDDRLPLAAARNAGAERAIQLGAELLIFLDVDCIPGPELVRRYTEYSRLAPAALSSGSVAYLPPPGPSGYPLSDLAELAVPHPSRPDLASGQAQPGGDVRLFWSLSFAVTTTVWRRIGGFCELYRGYGAEDTDFGQLVARAGFDLHWLGGAPAFHQHHPTSNPPTQHLDDILRNGRIFRARWGWWPMSGWLTEFQRLGLVSYDARHDEWTATPLRTVPVVGLGS